MLDNSCIIPLILAISWGISPIIYKLILDEISIELLLLTSCIIILLLVVLYLIYRWNRIEWKTDKLSILVLVGIVAMVIIGILVPNYLYSQLLRYRTFKVVILAAFASLVTIIGAHLFLGEEMNSNSWLGVVLVLIGSMLILYDSPMKLSW